MHHSDVNASGSFTSAGGIEVRNIARWDGAQWHSVGDGLSSSVRSLLVLDNGDLIAGGNFRFSGDLVVNHIAQWDGQAWHRIASGLETVVTGLARDGRGALVAATDNALFLWNGTVWQKTDSPRLSITSIATLPSGHICASLQGCGCGCGREGAWGAIFRGSECFRIRAFGGECPMPGMREASRLQESNGRARRSGLSNNGLSHDFPTRFQATCDTTPASPSPYSP